MSDDETPTYRCRASVDGQRCEFRGTRAELDVHAADAGHPRCIICARPLTEFERQTCSRRLHKTERQPCADRVRDDLDAVVAGYAHLERRIREGAYSGGWLTPLAMVADGSVSGGGEDDHVRWHDPLAVVAVLEAHDRDWRETFGHPRPPYLPLGHPDRHPRVVLRDIVGYLRAWHALAARTHPGFDDYATELRELLAVVEFVVGLVERRQKGIPCECGADLERRYAMREADDDWCCRRCERVYSQAEYLWRLRMLAEVPGWVSVETAAARVDRPPATVWAWVRLLEVPAACNRVTQRIVVELAAVQSRSATTGRMSRRTA